MIKILNKVKPVERILLIIAIICILLSSILTLYFGDNLTINDKLVPTFIWFSIIGCIWICFLSTVYLIVSIIIFKLNRLEIWTTFKNEIILTIVLISSITIFHLCTLTVYN